MYPYVFLRKGGEQIYWRIVEDSIQSEVRSNGAHWFGHDKLDQRYLWSGDTFRNTLFCRRFRGCHFSVSGMYMRKHRTRYDCQAYCCSIANKLQMYVSKVLIHLFRSYDNYDDISGMHVTMVKFAFITVYCIYWTWSTLFRTYVKLLLYSKLVQERHGSIWHMYYVTHLFD